MVGTRGVPAHYGGFETAIEEIGTRLVDRGHDVVVYCRNGEEKPKEYRGMQLVHLPALHTKSLETLTHTALSVLHLITRRRKTNVAFVFNAANAPFLPFLRLRRVPVAVHVDGLEWKRAKWSGFGARFYRTVEALSVRWADALIADARAIGDYYQQEFGVAATFIAYGAPILRDLDSDKVAELDLKPRQYHLVVARFEPENKVLEIVRGYTASSAEHPLVVVGSAPYADEYTAEIQAVADADSRIRLLGGVWDQDLLNQLYAHALTYLHGHSVGGTNPSLLRAMGAGAPVVAFDVNFNREVLGDVGQFFSDETQLAALVLKGEADPVAAGQRGRAVQSRAEATYDWDEVADRYEELAASLHARTSTRGTASGRRQTVST